MSNGWFPKFFSLDNLFGEKIVGWAYLIGSGAIVISALGNLFGAFSQGFWSVIGALFVTPVVIVLGMVIWRVVCEFAVAVFQMNQNLSGLSASMTDWAQAQQAASASEPEPVAEPEPAAETPEPARPTIVQDAAPSEPASSEPQSPGAVPQDVAPQTPYAPPASGGEETPRPSAY